MAAFLQAFSCPLRLAKVRKCGKMIRVLLLLLCGGLFEAYKCFIFVFLSSPIFLHFHLH